MDDGGCGVYDIYIYMYFLSVICYQEPQIMAVLLKILLIFSKRFVDQKDLQ